VRRLKGVLKGGDQGRPIVVQGRILRVLLEREFQVRGAAFRALILII